MSTEPVQPKDLTYATSVAPSDLIIVQTKPSQNTNTAVQVVTANVLFNNTNVSFTISNGNYLFMHTNITPVNSTSNVSIGRIWFDDNYMYRATSNNVIKRIPMESF